MREDISAGGGSSIRILIGERRVASYLQKHLTMSGKLTTDACRVLVVDDDKGIREALAELLAYEGYGVTVARNGQEALDVCRSLTPPDLVLLDMQMPVMDGLGFLRMRDADPRLSRIPVCVMTAFQGPLGIPNTVSVILTKPVGFEDVVDVANRFCPMHPTKDHSRTDRQTDAGAAQSSDPRAARSASPAARASGDQSLHARRLAVADRAATRDANRGHP